MSDIIRIWVEISHSSAYRAGGWAYVRAEGRALSGAAGGDRTTSPDAVALTGLVAALQDLPANSGVEILSAKPRTPTIGRRLTAIKGGDGAPDEDLALWAQLSTALGTRT